MVNGSYIARLGSVSAVRFIVLVSVFQTDFPRLPSILSGDFDLLVCFSVHTLTGTDGEVACNV